MPPSQFCQISIRDPACGVTEDAQYWLLQLYSTRISSFNAYHLWNWTSSARARPRSTTLHHFCTITTDCTDCQLNTDIFKGCSAYAQHFSPTLSSVLIIYYLYPNHAGYCFPSVCSCVCVSRRLYHMWNKKLRRFIFTTSLSNLFLFW